MADLLFILGGLGDRQCRREHGDQETKRPAKVTVTQAENSNVVKTVSGYCHTVKILLAAGVFCDGM
jgi:hypothetical protein